MGLGEAVEGKKIKDRIDEDGTVTRITAAGSKARAPQLS